MIKGALCFLLVCMLSVGVARATYMEREADAILSFEIEGVSLSMTPDEARATVEAAGFELFQALGADQENPFGWHYIRGGTRLELHQKDGVLIQIFVMIFPEPEPLETGSEIERMQRHFEVAEGEKWCWVKEQSGVCSVRDQEARLIIVMRAAPFGFDVKAQRY